MFELEGKNGKAIIYQDRENVEDECIKQIVSVMDSESVKGSTVRIMPDLHAGAGICIGFTQKLADRVVPNFVGVDIGCGMLATKFSGKTVEEVFGCEVGLKRLDEIWRKNIPMGMVHRKSPHKFTENIHLDNILAPINKDNALLSLGTLGGGNHFGELDKDEDGNFWLVIHSGSRHMGLEIAKHYQNIAIEKHPDEPKSLAYLDGDEMESYMNDMRWAQDYAMWNREAMLDEIIREFGLKKDISEKMQTIHNYIDVDKGIVRKGAISLDEDELAIIPMNMRDGSLIVRGKGNPDWNFSGPHGAGRVLSRKKAKETLKMEDFKITMKGVFSTSVSVSTLDESPMAYKPMDTILANIGDTCDIKSIIKPVWNVKAGDSE